MITENAVLMRQARESLKGKWGLAIGTFLIYMLILGAVEIPIHLIPPAGIILIVIAGPLVVGLATFSLSISRNEEASVGQLFLGFSKFGVSLAAYLLVTVFVFLWLLLLIVPGIIMSIAYSMTFFIIAEDSSISAMDAIRKSKMMMDGYKWKYFCLCLRFIGWALLCILTLGIGFLWLIPYMYISMAKFYEEVKALHEAKTNPQPAA